MNRILDLHKTLSDETRLRILILLSEQELCVCQLQGIMNVPQPRISKNLAKLRDKNIVKDNRMEKFVYYSLNSEDTYLGTTLQFIKNEMKAHPNEYKVIQEDISKLSIKDDLLNVCNSN